MIEQTRMYLLLYCMKMDTTTTTTTTSIRKRKRESIEVGQLGTYYNYNGTESQTVVTIDNVDLIKLNQKWKDHDTICKFTCRFLSEVPVEIYGKYYFDPVICLKPDIFITECAKDLMNMNIPRRMPAIYYACPTGKSLDGLSWGNTTNCLMTPTGQTIMDILDEHMDNLLHLNRVSIATEIKDLLLTQLDITSIWSSNINSSSTDYKGLYIQHKNGEWTHINMVVIYPYSKGITKGTGISLHCPTSRRMTYRWVDGRLFNTEIFLFIVSRVF